MCGIVGAVAQRNIVPVLIEGLRRLEYRGYDSCGVAVLEPGAPKRARSVARVADLDAQVRESHLEGTTGVAHTRWATHGAPVTHNAHPIFSSNALALVHNGIIENFESLREALRAKGYEFVSQTDTEVIAHLVHSLYRGNLFDAVREAVGQLHGAYAIAVIHRTSRTPSSARARVRRSWSATATARTSSRPTHSRSRAAPTASRSSRKATCASCRSTA